jgi:isoquinoline 1-oxidoreductase beta subunit
MGTPAGDAPAVLQSATHKISADYELPYAAHATMEPMNCTADVRADGADVWVPTQAPTNSQRLAAQITGLSPNAVKVHVTMVGGGFGRRGRTDYLDDAVRLSKQINAPVKVMWTREDDMQHDLYRPFGIHRFEGALDADGWPLAWMHRIVTQNALGAGDSAGGAMDLPYAIPNLRVELNAPQIGVPVAPWRSVGHSQNGFVTESFLDELAVAGKKDPLELRRRLLANAPRYLGAMELAVSKSNWGKPMPAGQGRGIAVHSMTGTYVAQIAEVTVANNSIRVNKVVCAVDCGVVINPDTLAAQIEGAIIYGLTCALKNEITIKNGRVEQDNFNAYPMLRITEAPAVEVYTVASTAAPGGIGEPGVPPIAAAVGNAIFAATGKRLRKLPFRLA